MAANLGSSLVSAVLSDYKYATYGFLYFLVVTHIRSKDEINRLLLVAFCGAFLTGVYGMAQHFGYDWIEWYPKEPRVMASMGNPTFYAAYLILLLPLAVNFFLAVKTSEVRIGLGIVAGLMYLCLLFTYTRAPWLGLLMALAVNGVLLGKYVGLARLRAERVTRRETRDCH